MRKLFNGMTGVSLGFAAVTACVVFGLIALLKSHQTPDPEVPRRTPLKRQKITAPKRFYYMKSDSSCTDDRAAMFFDAYINDAIADEDLARFKVHVKECFACAVRIANAKTIRAAAEHYGIPPNARPVDESESIERFQLTVVDVTGEPLIRKYRQCLKCRENVWTIT